MDTVNNSFCYLLIKFLKVFLVVVSLIFHVFQSSVIHSSSVLNFYIVVCYFTIVNCLVRKKFLKNNNRKTKYAQVVKNNSIKSSKNNINIESIMTKSFVCFLMAACNEKEHSGTFQSVLSTLSTQNNLPSIVMKVLLRPLSIPC